MQTELFLKAIDAYRTWISTGMNHREFSDLYELWDVAVLEYAASMNLERRYAADHIYMAIRLENAR